MVSGLNLVPNDSLKDLSHLRSVELIKRPLFLMVICAHCPFVKHVESGIPQTYSILLVMMFNSWLFLAIACKHTHKTRQNSWPLKKLINWDGSSHIYLILIQKLAKALKAACTPDFIFFGLLQMEDQN